MLLAVQRIVRTVQVDESFVVLLQMLENGRTDRRDGESFLVVGQPVLVGVGANDNGRWAGVTDRAADEDEIEPAPSCFELFVEAGVQVEDDDED